MFGPINNQPSYIGSAIPMTAREKQIYNDAVEDCCKYLENKSDQYNTAVTMLRKLKK